MNSCALTMMPDSGGIAEARVDIDHLALQLFGLLVAALLLHDIDENAEHARGVDMILAGFAETAEQRAANIGSRPRRRGPA